MIYLHPGIRVYGLERPDLRTRNWAEATPVWGVGGREHARARRRRCTATWLQPESCALLWISTRKSSRGSSNTRRNMLPGRIAGKTEHYCSFQSCAVALDGVSIVVHVWAGGCTRQDAPPLHGFSQCHSWLQQFAGSLGQDFRLVTYDLRGHDALDNSRMPTCTRNRRLLMTISPWQRSISRSTPANAPTLK